MTHADSVSLPEFLKARLNEDEQWALAASAPYGYAVGNPPVPEGGVHWTWVVGENWTPVTPDPATDEFIENDGEWSCNLATVEEWQSGVGNWMMRRTYAGTIQEMDPSAAGHIARHDPARALREVAAMRRIMARHKPVGPSRYRTVREELNCEGCGWEGEHGDPVTEDIDECPELRDLASIYEGAPGWQERWCER